MFGWLKRRSTRPVSTKAATDACPDPAAQAHVRSQSMHHKSLGDQCLNAGAEEQAANHYRAAIALEPGFAEAHCRLGDALRSQGQHVPAADCYRKALTFAPDLVDAHYGLGVTHLERSDCRNATVYFRNALARDPDFAKAHNALGFALLELGERSAAQACFQTTLRLDPDNGMAQHLTASMTGSNPERAPRQYIEYLFDGFASHFDTTLQQLQYDTPTKLSALMAQCRPDAAGNWTVLDLGCGTGLVGQAVAPFAGQLVGVDLSAKMLEKARARNVYQRLVHGDLISTMQEEKAAGYDLIVAADTFIYLGKLDDVAREAERLLADGGLFAFSVEALEALPGTPPGAPPPSDYQLQPAPSCRYAHSSEYIDRLASENHLAVRHRAMAHLRNSVGTSVRGYLVVMEKQSSAQAA